MTVSFTQGKTRFVEEGAANGTSTFGSFYLDPNELGRRQRTLRFAGKWQRRLHAAIIVP